MIAIHLGIKIDTQRRAGVPANAVTVGGVVVTVNAVTVTVT